MAYYLLIKENKILNASEFKTFDDDILDIEVTENLYDDYSKNPNKYIYEDGEIVINPNYKEELAEARKKDFESNFLSTSLGNYRLTPKGYANAQQSIDTINNIVTAMGSLTKQIADMIIFYETPEFTKEEQCTEEWLVEHQHSPNPMTKEEWTKFYIEFTTLYAQKQYQLSSTQI